MCREKQKEIEWSGKRQEITGDFEEAGKIEDGRRGKGKAEEPRKPS